MPPSGSLLVSIRNNASLDPSLLQQQQERFAQRQQLGERAHQLQQLQQQQQGGKDGKDGGGVTPTPRSFVVSSSMGPTPRSASTTARSGGAGAGGAEGTAGADKGAGEAADGGGGGAGGVAGGGYEGGLTSSLMACLVAALESPAGSEVGVHDQGGGAGHGARNETCRPMYRSRVGVEGRRKVRFWSERYGYGTLTSVSSTHVREPAVHSGRVPYSGKVCSHRHCARVSDLRRRSRG